MTDNHKARTTELFNLAYECSQLAKSEPEAFAKTIEVVIKENTWQKHFDEVKQTWFDHDCFRDYIEKDYPKGLGMDAAEVYGLMLPLQGDDISVLRVELCKLMPGIHGEAMRIIGVNDDAVSVADASERPVSSDKGGRPSKDKAKTYDNIISKNIYKQTGCGTSREYTLRRLAKSRPDLLSRVESGELSANAAAIEAGFRKVKTAPEQVMHWLNKCDPEELVEVLAEIADLY